MRGRLTMRCLLGMRERHLDHVDAEERRVRILLRVAPGAAGELFARADRARAGAVDVDVGLVVRIGDERVRVRPAARLHRRDLPRLLESVMSKMRTPRNRSALTGVATPCVPQSRRPRVCSTDMNSRLPCTDTSPWPPGHTIDAASFGFVGRSMSKVLKPWKLPMNRCVPLNARSEFANARKFAKRGIGRRVRVGRRQLGIALRRRRRAARMLRIEEACRIRQARELLEVLDRFAGVAKPRLQRRLAGRWSTAPRPLRRRTIAPTTPTTHDLFIRDLTCLLSVCLLSPRLSASLARALRSSSPAREAAPDRARWPHPASPRAAVRARRVARPPRRWPSGRRCARRRRARAPCEPRARDRRQSPSSASADRDTRSATAVLAGQVIFVCCCGLNSSERTRRRGVDLVLRQVLARLQLEDVEAARDLRSVDLAVVPVRRPVAADDQLRRASIGPRSKNAISTGCAASVKSNTETPP